MDPCLLILLVVAIHSENVLSISPSGAGHYCSCSKKASSLPWVKIRDFSLTERNDTCSTEIIVHMASGKKFCLDPDQDLGKYFQNCWKKINKKEKLKPKCLFKPKKKRSLM